MKRDFLLRMFDNQMRIYLTFRCNLRCEYCVNNFDGDIGNFKELSYQQWVDIINSNKRDVVFTGGEPFLFKDFFRLINNIDKKIKITVYSNLSFDIEDIISQIKRTINVYASLHDCIKNKNQFFRNFDLLKTSGHHVYAVHTVETEINRDGTAMLVSECAEKGIRLIVDKDQRVEHESCSKKNKMNVLCIRRIALISPEGYRHQCVSDIINRRKPLQDLNRERLGRFWTAKKCGFYGFCAPCDHLGITFQKKIN